MKNVIFLIILLLVVSSVLHLGGANAMMFLDYNEAIRVVSRGLSEFAGIEDVAKELIFVPEATKFIAALPVK